MNWYKIAQLSEIDVLENHGKNYLSIGHEGEYGNRYKKDYPNYIWVLSEGEILVEEETEENYGHIIAFPHINYGKTFAGRFDSSVGKLSVNRPFEGPSHFRDVPKSILYKLYQKFPGTKQIYVF